MKVDGCQDRFAGLPIDVGQKRVLCRERRARSTLHGAEGFKCFFDLNCTLVALGVFTVPDRQAGDRLGSKRRLPAGR
jgi:hypothetical protein